MTNTTHGLLLGLFGGSANPAASFTVTTTGAQTLTISGFTVTAATTVDWGDGSSSVYTGSGSRTHNYAGAGTWTVRIMQPLNVTLFSIISGTPACVITSSEIARMRNLTTLDIYALGTALLNSVDLAPLNLTTFRWSGLFNTGGLINLADWAHWRPTSFNVSYLYTGTYHFDSASIAAWNPTVFRINNITYASKIIAASDFAGWTAATTVDMSAMALTQAQVDAVLLGLYTAAQSRTATGGTINVAGTNAAPSGTLAAECPPVTGKGAAYELVNDSCGVIDAGETWTTVTITP